jgi:hypothetical protein
LHPHALELRALPAQCISTTLLAALANRIPGPSRSAPESLTGALRQLIVDHLDLGDDVGQLLAQLAGHDAGHHRAVPQSRDGRCGTRLRGSAHDAITCGQHALGRDAAAHEG